MDNGLFWAFVAMIGITTGITASILGIIGWMGQLGFVICLVSILMIVVGVFKQPSPSEYRGRG